jgi:AraC-like DNA-binding protein
MKIYIRSMINQCSIVVVTEILAKHGILFSSVQLGVVDLIQPIDRQQKHLLKSELEHYALELIEDKREMVVERIKSTVNELIYFSDELPKVTYSHYISEKLNLDYTYLSSIFSSFEGITIRDYIISRKIERAKELLLYGDLSLKEISYTLNYSSVAHLSNQFKKVTGLCPTIFKESNIALHQEN